MPRKCDLRDRLETQARALARATHILRFLRQEGLLNENSHLVLGFADALLRSLRGLKLDAES